jgi:PAS domain S-box-containing protein
MVKALEPDRAMPARPSFFHLAAFALVYVAGGILGDVLAVVPNLGVSFWPPSGLFIATLLLAERRDWLRYGLAALPAELAVSTWWFGFAVVEAVPIYAGNTAEAFAAAWLIRRWCGAPFRLESVRQLVCLLLLGAALAPMLSAMSGATVLALTRRADFTEAWVLWWLGDATGVLIFAPLVVALRRDAAWLRRLSTGRRAELALLVLLLLVSGALPLFTHFPFFFAVMPAVLWAAARFELSGAAIASLLAAVMASLAARHDFGPFSNLASPESKQVLALMMIAVTTLTALLVAKLARRNREALDSLQRANADLEARVAERTAVLQRSEERLVLAVEAAQLGVWDLDLKTDRAVRSLNHDRMFGYQTLQPEWGKAVAERHFVEEDRPVFAAAFARALKEGTLSTEVRVRWPDGSVHCIAPLGRTYYDADGTPVRMAGVVADVTERKRIEGALDIQRRRYEAVLSTTPDLAYIFGLDHRFTYANEGLLRMWGKTWDEAIGKNCLELGYEPWHAEMHDREIEQVIATRQPVRGVVPFTGTFGRRIYDYILTPVLNEQGEVEAIAGLTRDVTDDHAAAETLRAAHDTFHLLVQHAPFGIYVVDAEFRMQMVSAGAMDLFASVQPLLGRDLAEVLRQLWPEPHVSGAIARFRHTLATGEPYRSPREPDQGDGGTVVELYDWRIERIAMPDGRPAVVCYFYDLSERHSYEKQIKLLLSEVNHRSKNMLGLVQAIARQTAATDTRDFVARFSERLQALSASQDLVVKNEWKEIPLADLVGSQLAPFADLLGTRIQLRGPHLRISPTAAQALGMALHELATNAGKYGSLSTASGSVDVDWSLDTAQGAPGRFLMAWIESGGPPTIPPTRRGFGTNVTTNLTRHALDAEVSVDYAPSGLVWRLSCSAENLRDHS